MVLGRLVHVSSLAVTVEVHGWRLAGSSSCGSWCSFLPWSSAPPVLSLSSFEKPQENKSTAWKTKNKTAFLGFMVVRSILVLLKLARAFPTQGVSFAKKQMTAGVYDCLRNSLAKEKNRQSIFPFNTKGRSSINKTGMYEMAIIHWGRLMCFPVWYTAKPVRPPCWFSWHPLPSPLAAGFKVCFPACVPEQSRKLQWYKCNRIGHTSWWE